MEKKNHLKETPSNPKSSGVKPYHQNEIRHSFLVPEPVIYNGKEITIKESLIE